MDGSACTLSQVTPVYQLLITTIVNLFNTQNKILLFKGERIHELMAQGSENNAPSKGLSGFLLPSFLLPFFQSGQRNFWVQLCWIFLFIKQDPHLYSWGGGVKPDWLNAAVSRGFVLAIKSEPKKKPAWWCVLIIPELRRRRKEAILGYLVCSWPIEEAFKGEAWTVPKESRPGCPLASISGICTHMQLHKHAQHICTVSKRAVSTCACVLLWWAQVMNPAS